MDGGVDPFEALPRDPRGVEASPLHVEPHFAKVRRAPDDRVDVVSARPQGPH
jgi:hypothetical protein